MIQLRRVTGKSALKSALLIALLLVAGSITLGLTLADNRSASADASTAVSSAQDLSSDAAQLCPADWQFVASPNPRTHHYLNDVVAIAPDDIWAVGEYYDENNYTPDTALAMHWDGASWTVVPTPESPFNARMVLYGVSAVSTTDVWAVGEQFPGSEGSEGSERSERSEGGDAPFAYQPLALHWDGLTWSIVPVPEESGGLLLSDVVALSANDVWAVGANDGAHATRAFHWNGTTWTHVPTPNGGGFSDDNVLTSIAAVAPNDIWAVGYIYPKGGTPTPISMHWNGTTWSMVSTPNPGNYARRLDAVTALAADDVWAVGSYSDDSGKTYTPLFLHWNGTAWQHIASPEFADYNSLEDVYGIAPDDIWAVGTSSQCNFCPFESLTMHWDGTAWSQQYAPNGFRTYTRLQGVAAVSSGDVWTVGFSDDSAFPYTSDSFILRRLCAVVTPTGTPPTATATRTNLPTYTSTATDTVAPSPTCNPSGMKVLIVYADYETPPSTLRDGILAEPGVDSVDMFRADTVTPNLAQLMQYDVVVAFASVTSWGDPTALGNALADYQDAHGIVVAFNFSWSGPPRGIAGRWLSGGYSPFQSPGANIYSTGTLGVHNAAHPLMAGVTDLTAFYRSNMVLNSGAEQVAAWNDGPPLIAFKARAVGVSAYVGDEDDGWSGHFGRVVANAGRWLSPGCNTPVPTQTSTSTSTSISTQTATSTAVVSTTATAGTATGTAATATGTAISTGTGTVGTTSTATVMATATATVCTVSFIDVPAGHTFYDSVQCLACRGVLVGYPDNTFRPQNNITRGQIAKVVSNAAGFAEPVTGQTFEDVLPGSTFYEFVERLAARDVMEGYECGAPGEPCMPGGRPYFRTGSSATRGQLAKIVSNAAGIQSPVSGQTFEDVVPGSTFYEFVERLASLSVMSGYPCGGPGEPCMPDDRPYFRPGSNVTRGQASKIVANTFFPGCTP